MIIFLITKGKKLNSHKLSTLEDVAAESVAGGGKPSKTETAASTSGSDILLC